MSTPVTRSAVVGWVLVSAFVAAVLLFAFASRQAASSSTPSLADKCETVWSQHEANAVRYGYPAGDHAEFVSACVQGDTDVVTASN